MKVLITGDRGWTDSFAVVMIIRLCMNFAKAQNETLTVIHGDCPTGADHFAELECERQNKMWKAGIIVDRRPADWKQFGRAAGPRRNAEMVALNPHLVFGFHNDIAHSKGTRDCLRKAKRAGLCTMLISTEF